MNYEFHSNWVYLDKTNSIQLFSRASSIVGIYYRPMVPTLTLQIRSYAHTCFIDGGEFFHCPLE